MRRNLIANFSSVFLCVLRVSVVESAYFDSTTEAPRQTAQRHGGNFITPKAFTN